MLAFKEVDRLKSNQHSVYEVGTPQKCDMTRSIFCKGRSAQQMIVWRHDKDYLEAQTQGRHHNHSGEEERKFKTQERPYERKGKGVDI